MADARVVVDATVPCVEALQPKPGELVVVRYTQSIGAMADDERERAQANLSVLQERWPDTTFVVLAGDVSIAVHDVSPGHVVVLSATHRLDKAHWKHLRDSWRRLLGDEISSRTVILDPPLAMRSVRCPHCSTVCPDPDAQGEEALGP